MEIKLLNETTAFSKIVTTREGITAKEFLVSQNGSFDETAYAIRVNRSPVTADYVLNEGDTVICLPQKNKGA